MIRHHRRREASGHGSAVDLSALAGKARRGTGAARKALAAPSKAKASPDKKKAAPKKKVWQTCPCHAIQLRRPLCCRASRCQSWLMAPLQHKNPAILSHVVGDNASHSTAPSLAAR